MKNIFDITSDIHTNFIYNCNKTIYGDNWVLKQNSDILIIAWDINESIEWIEKALKNIIINTSYQSIIVTFWNHDIRVKKDLSNGIQNSIDKYEYLIEHFHWFMNKIHVIDKEDFFIPNTKLILTWNMWWYNYTIKDLDKNNLEKYYNVNFNNMEFDWTVFNDKYYVEFNDKIKGNIEFATYLENKLIERLKQLKSNYNNYDYIAISHIKPHIDLEKDSQFYIQYNKKQWGEIIKEWNQWISKYKLSYLYWNAFFVNNNLSKIYKKYWVKFAIYGHTHYVWDEEIDWITYISNALWYYTQYNYDFH
jgi:hypothetical protein